MQPNNHHITLITNEGNPVYSKVVYLQPKAERWRGRSAVVHIVTRTWLEPARYSAIYVVNEAGSTTGHYTVSDYESVPEGWLFKGSFDSEKKPLPTE